MYIRTYVLYVRMLRHVALHFRSAICKFALQIKLRAREKLRANLINQSDRKYRWDYALVCLRFEKGRAYNMYIIFSRFPPVGSSTAALTSL